MTAISEHSAFRRFVGRPRVTVTRRLLPETEARMAELFDADLNVDDRPLTRDELIAAMQDSDVIVPTVTDRIDAAMIELAGERLKLIANYGAGTDHIALGSARAARILVTNTPAVFTEDTADLTMAMIISVPRRLPESGRLLHTGGWHGWRPSGLLGASLGGKRLAILGMGRIGQAVAHRARAFGLDIVYHNRHPLPAAIENMFGARYEPDIDRLVAEADILTLHCPAARDTHHVLDAARIAAMKPSAVVINTGRGDLIEQDALIAALESGRLAGAGLDVYPHEPELDPRLLTLPNVMLMPHVGSATSEGRATAGERVIANIRFWADGHRPRDQVLEGWV